VINQTILYRYDAGGNILDKKVYAYTTGTPGTVQNTITYEYNDSMWKDKLTRYNGSAEPITYDGIGNPTENYFTWDRGRQLSSVTDGGSLNATYEYNDRGIRTKKTVGSVVTEYHLVGSRVTWESDGTNTLYYYYNGAGDLFGLKHKARTEAHYYYVKNAQGDIIRILDDTGAVVVEYIYDTWGKMVGTPVDNSQVNLAELNPYRYRSYRYDSETGLYYLNSRYYDPEVGRFINADHAAVSCFTPMGLTDKNLFAYCDNNPVVRKDADGDVWHIVAGALAGAAWRGYVNYLDGRNFSDGLLAAAVSGAILAFAIPHYIVVGLPSGGAAKALLCASKMVLSVSVIESAGKQFEKTVKWNWVAGEWGFTGARVSPVEFLFDTVTLFASYLYAVTASSCVGATTVVGRILATVFLEGPILASIQIGQSFGHDSSSNHSAHVNPMRSRGGGGTAHYSMH
jgi:RHS repeat-associated protein